jgi:molybdopterin synthase sulfur carrier subunit
LVEGEKPESQPEPFLGLFFMPDSLAIPSYLDPNSGSLQKPIGGRSVLAPKPTNGIIKNRVLGIQPVFQPLNKGGIDCSKQLARNSLIPPTASTPPRCPTLQVSVRFFTSLRETIGKKEETLTLPDNQTVTIETILETLKQRYGKPFTEYVYDSKSSQVRSFLQFLINGKSATTLSGLQTKMQNGDVLAILPPVGGG